MRFAALLFPAMLSSILFVTLMDRYNVVVYVLHLLGHVGCVVVDR